MKSSNNTGLNFDVNKPNINNEIQSKLAKMNLYLPIKPNQNHTIFEAPKKQCA